MRKVSRPVWILACMLLAAGPAAGEDEAPAVVAAGKTIGIEMSLTLADGSLVETTEGAEPLRYVHGEQQILPALEESMLGMKVDEARSVTVPAEDGFGPVRPDLIREVSTSEIPQEAQTVGSRLMAHDPEGNQQLVKVKEIRGETIVLDLNHPLAGEVLHYDVKVVSIE